MGKNLSKSYDEQEKAIQNGEVSFDLNIYFIGEEVSTIYKRFEALKSQSKKDLFSFWNYYYYEGNYSSQLKEMKKIFDKRLENFSSAPDNNTFKEVIIVRLKQKDEHKIDEIFSSFASDQKDVYCPFIIFFFDQIENNFENIVPDPDNYYISPLKVFSYKFGALESDEIKEFHKRLFRICSYYNELGDQFLIWTKDSEDPVAYDLINAEFNSYINIFCLGKTGSGKSTFLNKFFREKKSKQGGTGRSTTSKIVRFGIDGIPIRIFDIPGFEGEETIEKVNNKLIQTASEMNTDKDKIHLILYFINAKEETIVYEMERKIMDTLKSNNKDVRIIFVYTHSSIDPYSLQGVDQKKNRKKIDIVRDKEKKVISIISSIFGDSYSYKNDYFQKDSLIQKNLIFVNLEQDYENDKEPFGFDKVIKSIYETITEGNDLKQLGIVNQKLIKVLIEKIKNDEKLNKEIEECLSKGYLLQQTTFALQKEKSIKEAQKVYDGMFGLGKTLLTISPFYRDIKLGIIKYQKYQFKKKLNKIFGFNIKNKEWDFLNANESEYEKINREYIEKNEKKKEIEEKQKLMNEIKKDYNANEVNSTWIVANEVVGLISYGCLFGGPILMPIGAIGLAGTSYISYKQFKSDCTEYFEQYKAHYEEYKYYSLYNFINCVLLGIEYFENYLICLEDKAAPNAIEVIQNHKNNMEQDFKTAKGIDKPLGHDDEIRENVPFLQ